MIKVQFSPYLLKNTIPFITLTYLFSLGSKPLLKLLDKSISITFLLRMFYIFSSQSIVQRSGRALWQLPCRTETQSPAWPMAQISTHGPVFMTTGMLSITPPMQPHTRELRSSGVELPRTQTIWHLKMLLRFLHEVLGTFWYTDFTARVWK